MIYTLPDLPYDYAALEPYIDEQTMRIHHDKHHAAYIDKLNSALEKYPEVQQKNLTELLQDLNSLPDDIKSVVRNNGGGHINHSLFWEVMGPNKGGEPGGEIKNALIASFGSFEAFKEKFTNAGIGRFGSGWVWLLKDGNRLEISDTPNQDNPLMDGKQMPILGLDVWEHSYYLKWQNKRADYIAAWWDVVNWEKVEENFTKTV